MYGPILKEEMGWKKSRLRIVQLRPPREDDAQILIDWLADLEVTQTLGRIFTMSIQSEKEWLEKEGSNPQSVIWIIETYGESGWMPIGITGIHNISPIHRHATTGTIIGDKVCWGKGYGSAVMKMRAKFAFEQLGLHKLNSAYLDGNIGSQKAQTNTGYREVGRRRQEFWRNGHWVDEVLTEVLAEDWFQANPRSE